MPNGISKRQQLRNEKTLAELIRTVPGNDRCADCDALTPGLFCTLRSPLDIVLTIVSIQDGQAGTYALHDLDPYSSLRADQPPTDGYLSMSAVRLNSPQAGHTYFQSQVIVYGYLVLRAG